MKRILQGLLDYARPASPELAPLDVNDAVDTALGLVASQKEFEGVAWVKDFDAAVPGAVADAHLLEQILINLLLNAAQATKRPGPVSVGTEAGPADRWRDGNCRVGRAFAPDDEVVAIHVTDQGPGIPPDHLGRIFEPFFSTKGRGRNG